MKHTNKKIDEIVERCLDVVGDDYPEDKLIEDYEEPKRHFVQRAMTR